MHLKKICLFCLLVTIQHSLMAQDSISIGSRMKLQSGILNEEREIWIHLPAKFDQAKAYSIAYLLDGEINFAYFTAISDFLFRGTPDAANQLVVIGIINSNRTRDLTPTKSFAINPKNQQKLFEDSGGSEAFFSFLQKELKPYLVKQYPRPRREVFIGHSFGALAVIDCLVKHPDYFTDYVSIDPSLWWDNGYEARIADSIWKADRNLLKGRKLFLTHSGVVITGHFGADGSKINAQFNELLNRQQTGLLWKSKTYANEPHGTISLVSNMEALRFLFQLN